MPYSGKRTLPQSGKPIENVGYNTLSPHSAQLTAAEGELTYSDRMKRNETRHVERDDTKAPVTQGLRPGYDLATTDIFRNRGQIVERAHDWSRRSWMIARAKSVAARSWSCSKHIKPQSHGVYDQVTNYLRPKNVWNRGHVVERTYDWSQRSWVIARANSVVTMSMVIF